MNFFVESITVSAFKSVGMNQTVHFMKNRIYSLLGVNNDEGGSNASGKSSLVYSVICAILGPKYVPVSVKELHNDFLDEVPTFDIVLLLDNDRLRINRKIGGTLTYQLNNEPEVTGKVDDVQNKINKLIGLTPDQLVFLLFKEQGKNVNFLTKKDAEKKEFLGSFFDLKFIEKADDKINKEVSTTKNNLDSLILKLSRGEGEISVLSDSLNDLSAKMLTIPSTKEELALLALKDKDFSINLDLAMSNLINFDEESLESVVEINLKIKDLSNDINVLNDIFIENKNKINAFDYTKYDQYINIETSIEEAHYELNRANQISKTVNEKNIKSDSASRSIDRIKYDISNKINELEAIKKSQCKVCGQDLNESVRQHNMSKVQKEVDLLVASLSEKELIISDNYVDEGAIKKLNDHIMNLKVKIGQLSSSREDFKKNALLDLSQKQDDLDKKIKSLKFDLLSLQNQKKTIISQQKSQIELDISNLKNEIRHIQVDMRDLTLKIESIEKDYSKRDLDLKNKQLEMSNLANDKSKMESRLKKLEKIQKIFSKDGFISYLFDDILEQLNIESNKNLKLVSNARKFSILMSPDKTVKSTGVNKQNISYTIYRGSKEVSLGSLSGGEENVLLASVDEALDTVLSRRIGVNVGLKFLDEQFGFTDNNSKEGVLDLLRSKIDHKAYVLVDHASEFNSAADNTIIATKTNGVTTFDVHY